MSIIDQLRRHTTTWPNLCAICIVIYGDTEKRQEEGFK